MFWHKAMYISILAIVFIVGVLFFLKKKPQDKKIKREPKFASDIATTSDQENQEPLISNTEVANASDDPSTIIMQLRANSGRPYMGYELLQVILETGFRFGKMSLFHRHQNSDGTGPILFSLAAASDDGKFDLNSMGGISVPGVIMFMRVEGKKKLMSSFDLMLDVARQFIDDLGGEILDVTNQPFDTAIINNWRQKITALEGKDYYKANMFDDL